MKNRSRLIAVSITLSLGAGCGGEGDNGDKIKKEPVFETFALSSIISDFEADTTDAADDGDGLYLTDTDNLGLDGFWETDSGGHPISPDQDEDIVTVAEGANGSTRALRFQAEEDSGWGFVIAATFKEYPKDFTAQLSDGSNGSLGNRDTFDASQLAGVSFYAKVGVGSGNIIRPKIPTPAIVPDSLGGECPAAANYCWQDHGKEIALSTEWVRYDIPFAQMISDAPVAFDPSKAFSLDFGSTGDQATSSFSASTTSPRTFDLYLDEVRFLVADPDGDISLCVANCS